MNKTDFTKLANDNGYSTRYSGETNEMFIKKVSYLKGAYKPSNKFIKEARPDCGFKIVIED